MFSIKKHEMCVNCPHAFSTEHEEQRGISESAADLGCFIQPSRCMCPLASLSCCAAELPLSRHRPSGRCREQSLDMPHVAGRQGEHFGWHKAWHSEERGGGEEASLKREKCYVSYCVLSVPQKEKGIN